MAEDGDETAAAIAGLARPGLEALEVEYFERHTTGSRVERVLDAVLLDSDAGPPPLPLGMRLTPMGTGAEPLELFPLDQGPATRALARALGLAAEAGVPLRIRGGDRDWLTLEPGPGGTLRTGTRDPEIARKELASRGYEVAEVAGGTEVRHRVRYPFSIVRVLLCPVWLPFMPFGRLLGQSWGEVAMSALRTFTGWTQELTLRSGPGGFAQEVRTGGKQDGLSDLSAPGPLRALFPLPRGFRERKDKLPPAFWGFAGGELLPLLVHARGVEATRPGLLAREAQNALPWIEAVLVGG